MADEKYLTEQEFLDRMRDFRIAMDKRYKFKSEDDPAVESGAPILGFEPFTIEGAMWLTVDLGVSTLTATVLIRRRLKLPLTAQRKMF